jgi:hypothetical protein
LAGTSLNCSCSGVEAGDGGTIAGGVWIAGAGKTGGGDGAGCCADVTADMIVAIEPVMRTTLARRMIGQGCMNIDNLPSAIELAAA